MLNFCTNKIHFQPVLVTYPDNIENVLHNINLTIKKGETLGIIGRCKGKTSQNYSDALNKIKENYTVDIVNGTPTWKFEDGVTMGYLVSSDDDNPEYVMGHKVYTPDEIYENRNDYVILIATTKYYNEIKNTLSEQGFINVF